jgi:hypothetical protein
MVSEVRANEKTPGKPGSALSNASIAGQAPTSHIANIGYAGNA